MHLPNQAPLVVREPPNAPWPEEEQEQLDACPVCGSRERTLVYQDRRDVFYFCAPGAWTAWKCEGCAVVYIDPRPSAASIHKAYASYFTHSRPTLSLLGKLLAQVQLGIRRSHLNKALGYRLSGALPFGWIAYKALPRQSEITNHTIRHLPPPQPGKNRLLDIGCRNGEFLDIARDIGFDASGLEVDPVARAEAQKAGFVVHPGPYPGAALEPDSYDHITMSHVLEHFHDPAEAIRDALRLLKPGGRIWVKVPNLAALSHDRFDKNFCILDAPRHLVMFDRRSLADLLRVNGFENIVALTPNFLEQVNIYIMGWAASRNYDPNIAIASSSIPKSVRDEAVAAYEEASKTCDRAEAITIIATKPN